MSGIAIIGGTGLEQLPEEYSVERLAIDTVFGRAAASRAKRGDEEFIFLSRHGESHGIAPHQINYRANIAALVELGVKHVFATNAVGSLRTDLPPGSLVVLSDFIDFTNGRPLSFWDGHPNPPAPVVHTDFSVPYCPILRDALIEAALADRVEIVPQGTYVCANGPRFESPAEIRLFAQWGGDVVGMTGLPEAIFAREAGLCYAGISIVTNFGAGLTNEAVQHEEVVAQMAVQVNTVRSLLLAASRRLSPNATCKCSGNS
jgi:5'-methylthioadenosine phosphorylase